jgi:pilus assembly protein CpaE
VKIAVVSPNTTSLQEIQRLISTDDRKRSIALHEGGPGQVRVVADQHSPNLIIVDSMCRDITDLRVMEYVSIHHPNTALVMLCANQTPEFLVGAMRAGVREVLHSPPTKEVLLACIDRIEQRLGIAAQPKQPARVLAFVPCKGGSGATFLATNLGYQLASENKKVLLIDLNLQFGDAVLFVHDQKPSHTLADIAHNIGRLDASFLSATAISVSPNYTLVAAPEDPAHATEVKPEHIEVLLNLAAKHYDFVIIDAGRNLDAVTLKALDRADFIFPVLQLTVPFMRDASRLLVLFRALGYDKEKIRLLINRFERGGEITLDDVKRTFGVDAYRTIPNNYQAVASAVNQGRPIASFARNNPVAKALQDLAQALARPADSGNALLGRLLRRGA